ncbi:hypothetical protein AeMF1_019144 [Aphanomyces euteiches]|nr:hypothetical protein AeMF1_019144 [Aphanomyces euteiches]KAH9188282.1 hypothetical protein AeNC1_009740 [Aphanomyces euteiches]
MEDERQAKRAKVEKQLGFRLTSLRSGTSTQNRETQSLATLLDGAFTEAILTNYKVDVDWLFAQSARLQVAPVLLVHGSSPASMSEASRQFKNVTVIAPPLPIPYGTHHTKMMILFFDTFVRVAIFTANFVAGDWESKTQGVWMQEFPRRGSDASSDSSVFQSDLLDYMSSLGPAVAKLCQDKFPLYDFSKAEVLLVSSVPGIYRSPAEMEKYGHLRMKRLFQRSRLSRSQDHPLICQYSSLGSLDEKWLVEFFKSMTGATSAVESPIPAGKLHCIWPSVAAVQNSIQGWDAGRSLPCSIKNMKPFLHKYLRAWDPPEELHRRNAMPHIKSYTTLDPNTRALDYVLLTSANLSKAAWGTLQKNNTQFMIRSYELGVLFLPTEDVPNLRFAHESCVEPASLYFPLPFRWPPTRYNSKTEEPWCWDIERTEKDIFGQVYLVD